MLPARAWRSELAVSDDLVPWPGFWPFASGANCGVRADVFAAIGGFDESFRGGGAGVDAPYLCRGGACGQCETNVHKCEGTILHRDHWLTPEEHAANRKIMPCVSRFEGKTLVIDR